MVCGGMPVRPSLLQCLRQKLAVYIGKNKLIVFEGKEVEVKQECVTGYAVNR